MARDAAFGDIEAEAEQFTVDAGRAPVVLGGHPPDEGADLGWQRRAARAPSAPGQPAPVGPEPSAAPPHDGVWLDDGEALSPAAPEAAQQDPEDSVGGPNDGALSTGEGRELLAEGQVLEDEVAPGAQSRAERRKEGYEEANHRAGEDPGSGPNRQWFQSRRGFG